jgi:hypothetical protein
MRLLSIIVYIIMLEAEPGASGGLAFDVSDPFQYVPTRNHHL